MARVRDREEIQAPRTFAHLEGYPPLEGENLQQYLERINPILDKAVRKKPVGPDMRWLYGMLALWLVVAAALIYSLI